MFHTPIVKGIYASEGWFLKLMERHKHYTVRDHRKANLFCLPFSSRLLEFAFFERGLRKQDMAARLLDHVNTISRKYAFWNRTGGTGHFLAACHEHHVRQRPIYSLPLEPSAMLMSLKVLS